MYNMWQNSNKKNEEIALRWASCAKVTKGRISAKIKLAKRETIFFFSPAPILLSVQISLVRFGYIDKGTY